MTFAGRIHNTHQLGELGIRHSEAEAVDNILEILLRYLATLVLKRQGF